MVDKVTRGQPINLRAEDWNRFADLVNPSLSARFNVGREQSLARAIKVYNSTGSDRSVGQILPLTGSVWTRSDDVTAWGFATAPLKSDDTPRGFDDRFAIALQPIPSGEFGLCAIDGIAPMEVRIANHIDTYCGPFEADSHQYMTSSTGGSCTILARENANTTGTQQCIVQLHKPTGMVTGTLDGDLTKDGSQTISRGAYSSYVTVWDEFLETGKKLSSGGFVAATWWGGVGWVVVQSNACPVDV